MQDTIAKIHTNRASKKVNMRSNLRNKIILVTASLLSILAQGLVFAPSKFEFILRSLPPWGNITYGAIIYILSITGLVFIIKSLKINSYTNWVLIAIQPLTVIGLFILQNGFTSRVQEVSFLITAPITILTGLGIFLNMTQVLKTDSIPQTEIAEPANLKEPTPYIESNSKALNEQIELIARKLKIEKHRTTQLTFLNELSQQLESELDPPVAAQLAVNMRSEERRVGKECRL